MKESYSEGLASHTGPESWGYGGNGVSQALTGERAGLDELNRNLKEVIEMLLEDGDP